MRSLLKPAALLIALAAAAPILPQTPRYGERFPLTATGRIPIAPIIWKIVSDGHEPVLFWIAAGRIFVTPLRDGGPRVAREVLPTAVNSPPAAVWTGNHYLVFSQSGSSILVRKVSAAGEPLGEPETLLANASSPRLPADQTLPNPNFNVGPAVVLVVYRQEKAWSVLVSHDGKIASPLMAGSSPLTSANVRTARGSAALVQTNDGLTVVTFDRFGRKQSETVIADRLANSYSLAANDLDYLAVWHDGHGEAKASRITSRGEVRGTFTFDRADAAPYAWFTMAGAVWDGSRWIVAYTQTAYPPERNELRIVHLDERAAKVFARERRSGGVFRSIELIDGRVLVTWATQPSGALTVAPLPLRGTDPPIATLGPPEQSLLNAVSSATATLFVWTHLRSGGIGSVHAGVRDAVGRWAERELVALDATKRVFAAHGASDGRELAVAVSYSDGTAQWFRLDDRAELIAPPVSFSGLRADAIAWNGTHYGVVENSTTAFRAALLTREGVIEKLVSFPLPGNYGAGIASDGNGGFYLVWRAILDTNRLYGMRLRADLEPADVSPVTLAWSEAHSFSLAWNGAAYAIAWGGNRAVMFGTVAPSGNPQPLVRRLADPADWWVSVARAREGTAVTWYTRQGKPVSHFAIVKHDGAVIESEAPWPVDTRLLTLPDGRNAAVSREASRLLLQIIEPETHEAPDAPLVSARVESPDEVLLEWPAPPQPVSGYRVERRIGDEPWLETHVLRSDERTVRLPAPSGETIAFRVRAWNEAGLGAYSQPVENR